MSLALKMIIGISTIIVVLMVTFLGYMVFVAHAFRVFDREYTRKELVNSYSEHYSAIQTAISYYNSIVPAGKQVEVEFDAGDIDRIVVREGPAQHHTYSSAWASSSQPQLDSLVTCLGWSEDAVQQIQEKLKAADCISIRNGEPAVLGFERNGMGMYSFNVFSRPIADSLRKQYARSCTHIIQSNKLVLEYGGGAIGPQCFPANY